MTRPIAKQLSPTLSHRKDPFLMFSFRKPWMAVLGAALVVLTYSTNARAAAGDLEKLLPNDTEAVMLINFQQLLGAPLLTKGGAVDIIKEALKKNDDAQKIMADLGIDPLKDIESLISAQSGTDADKGLMILKGNFNVAKFQAKAEAVAKDNKDHLKIHKVKLDGAEYTVYEVSKLDELIQLPPELAMVAGDVKDAKTAFVGVDKSALLMSPTKEYVAEALAKAAGKKKTEIANKEMQTLLGKVDGKQTISMVLLAGALSKGKLGEEPQAKEVLAKLSNVTGGITVADGIKTQIVLAAKSGDEAKDLGNKVNEGLDQAQQLVGALVEFRKEMAPLLGIVKGVKATSSEKTVTIDSDISGDAIRELAKILAQAINKNK
jgi:hypothetical protein